MEVEHEEGRDETHKNLRSSLALLWSGSESLKRSSMKIQRAKLPNFQTTKLLAGLTDSECPSETLKSGWKLDGTCLSAPPVGRFVFMFKFPLSFSEPTQLLSCYRNQLAGWSRAAHTRYVPRPSSPALLSLPNLLTTQRFRL